MRCDLHVHSRGSGAAGHAVLHRVALECYSDPGEVYRVARQRGMDLVTLTDHDAIEGAVAIAHLPGTFVSEELTCGLPGGGEVHLGVYDLGEEQHRELQRRRRDAESVLAYLAEQRLPFALNHPLSALTGWRRPGELSWVLARVPLLESRNGTMPRALNAAAARVARDTGARCVGGSDAHTLDGVGRTWTEVPGASTREDFLDGLRRGFTVPRGRSGGYARLTADLATIVDQAWAENLDGLRTAGGVLRFAGTLALAPLVPLVPLVTAVLHLREQLFAWSSERALMRGRVAPMARRGAEA